MRINLQCPDEDKDRAKALGAKWDPARKVWYIVDVEDLSPFMRWISTKSKSKNKCSPRPQKRPVDELRVTGPKIVQKGCSCDVLPWEDCEHTDEQAHQAMLEMLSLCDLKL